jgi:hypothetical protein
MPPKKTREQKDAAAAKKAEQRAAKREAQTSEETRAELERLAQQQRELRDRGLETPLSRNRESVRLETANNSVK